MNKYVDCDAADAFNSADEQDVPAYFMSDNVLRNKKIFGPLLPVQCST